MEVAAPPPNLEPQLIAAATAGNVAQVGALLDQGVDIEARDFDGEGALHWASQGGHREVVALLLDRGADIEAVSDTEWTPIIFASNRGFLEVVEMLHARGGNIHQTTITGTNALHWAAWEDHLPVCEFLLSKGADLMAADNDGDTALSHYGCHADPALSPETKTLRIAALNAAHIAYLRGMQEADHSTNNDLRNTIDSQERKITSLKQTPASLLFSDAFSDLVFVCPGGERIHAHRNIVSACSPHARALLQGPWAENADERVAVVQMPQSAAAVRALLRFLYTGEADAAAVEASMSDVLDLASQHEQPALKAACERHALAALSVSTVVPMLVTAHLHDLAALKAACVGLITASVQNAAAVMASKAFITLESTHPLLWRELRAALGLPEEEEQQQEEEEGQVRKRARHDN